MGPVNLKKKPKPPEPRNQPPALANLFGFIPTHQPQVAINAVHQCIHARPVCVGIKHAVKHASDDQLMLRIDHRHGRAMPPVAEAVG